VGRHLVIEEKLDGANCALSFDVDGALLLQSRGHFLDGGPREKHFALLKTWANTYRQILWELLESRFVMYGEWLFAKHSIFYDLLPHYFLEFDMLDKTNGTFLATERRRAMLFGSGIESVPVLCSGRTLPTGGFRAMVAPSLFKSREWREQLSDSAASLGLDVERVLRQTDSTDLMEGLYIKVEEEGVVEARCKYIRSSFLASVLESDGHWLNRPIIANRLAQGVDIFRQ
jgi:hypothetical protein